MTIYATEQDAFAAGGQHGKGFRVLRACCGFKVLIVPAAIGALPYYL
jgi:hypothetical protein